MQYVASNGGIGSMNRLFTSLYFFVAISLYLCTALGAPEDANWYTRRQNLDAMERQVGTAYNYPPKRDKSVQTAVQGDYPQITTSAKPQEPADYSTDIYVGILGGAITYPFQNATPEFSGAGGVVVGIPVGLDFWAEGGFLYSFQEAGTLQASSLAAEDVDHFGFSGALKSTFGFSNNWIMPTAGVLLAYTYRRFNGDERTSSAVDGGLSAGVEVAMNRAINLGVEGRYMRNFSFEAERSVSPQRASQLSANRTSSQDLESLDYWVLLLNAKMKF